MGVGFELVEDVGPVIAEPIRRAADVERLRVPAGEEAAPQVIAAVRQVVAESPVPVVGFSGAPVHPRQLPDRGPADARLRAGQGVHVPEPDAFDALLGKLTDDHDRLPAAQVAAGADASSSSTSWVGALAPRTTRRACCPTRARSSPRSRRSACRASTSATNTARPAGADGGGRPRHRAASTGACRSTSPGSASATTSASRATSTRPRCWRRRRCCASRRAHVLRRAAAGPAMSSTSATACCPRRRSTTCTPGRNRARVGAARLTAPCVIAMDYGSPRDEAAVEAYYTHIRGGRAPSPEALPS